MYLQQFHFDIVHRPGKENKNADALSRSYEFDVIKNVQRIEVESYFCGAEILGEEPDDNEETNTSESSFYETASKTKGIEDEGNEADSEDNSDEECATRSPIPWKCCNQIICACTRISPVEYVDYDSDDEEIALGRLGQRDRAAGTADARAGRTDPGDRSPSVFLRHG